MIYALVPLVIPVFGVIFVEGWNWTWNDFLFAWVFLMVAISTFRFTRSRVTNSMHKKLVGGAVVLFFAAIWVMLATG